MKKSNLFRTTIPVIAFIFLLCLTFGCQQVEEGITEEEAKVLLDKILTVYNEGNLAVSEEINTPDYVLHISGYPEDIVGIDAFKEYVTNLRIDFPDFKVTFNEKLVKGDRIVVLWNVTGTNTGSSSEMPPTGKAMQLEGVVVMNLVDGKVAKALQYYNQVVMFTQLGYTITPPSFEVEEEPTEGEE